MAVMRPWLAALTAAAVLSVGLATVAAPAAATAPAVVTTTVTEFPLAAGKPEEIALAPDGTVWISHWDDNAVSRITDAGTSTGPALAVPGGPGGIVVGPGGTVYSAQGGVGGNTIARITPDGPADPDWADVPAPGGPLDLAVDAAGNLYTANFVSRTISRVSPDGAVTGAWATVTTRPYKIAVHPVSGVLLGSYDGTVTRIDADGVPTVVRGAMGIFTSDVTYGRDGTAYVADFYGTIARISASGAVTPTWATVGGTLSGIAVDGDGDVYVSRYDDDTIVKIDADGTMTSPWVTVPAGFMPGALAVSPDGTRLWTASLTRAAIARVASYSPPGAVSDLEVLGRDEALAVSFQAPTNDGGSPVTGYEVSTDGGITWVAVAPTEAGGRLGATLTRSSDGEALVNGTRYAVTVRAVNAAGPGAVAPPVTGTPVAPRVTATPVAPSVTAPGPPTDVTVVPGDRQVTVSWRPPADDGGAPITGYTVVATAEEHSSAAGVATGTTGLRMVPAVAAAPRVAAAVRTGGRTAGGGGGGARISAVVDTAGTAEVQSCSTTATSCTVTELTNGLPYRFTVTATNSAGTSAPTASAAAVIPTAVPAPATQSSPTTEPTGATATAGTDDMEPATASSGPAAARPAEGLAYTGFTLVPALLTGLVLVVGGAVALIAGRRRSAAAIPD